MWIVVTTKNQEPYMFDCLDAIKYLAEAADWGAYDMTNFVHVAKNGKTGEVHVLNTEIPSDEILQVERIDKPSMLEEASNSVEQILRMIFRNDYFPLETDEGT